MTPERWREVQRLFALAEARPAAERERLLRSECADESIVQEVLGLLSARPTVGFLEPPPPWDPVLGIRLGEFVAIEKIGSGGMGVVYKARQSGLDRVVALKILPANLTLDQKKVDRFHREARSIARLRHPGIVQVISVGEEKGTHYIAMEYVPGRNLAEELVRLRQDLGAESEDPANLPSAYASNYCRTVADIVRQAADALQSAHELGIVHRDIKPNNLLLDPSRCVKVVDFGLARDEMQGSISVSGEQAGTLYYMSPEQVRAGRSKVDFHTDIYSLGVVLYELLTLHRPFEGDTQQEIFSGILDRDAPSIRKLNRRVPHDLETICTTAMEKDVSRRYASAAALRDDLARFLGGEAILAKDPSALELAARWCRRHRKSLTIGATAAAALVVGAIATSLVNHRQQVRDLEAALAATRASGPLRDKPLSKLKEVQQELKDLARLRSGSQVFADSGEDDALALEKELSDWGRELKESGLASLALAKDLSLSEGVREQHRLSALQAFQRGALLFPDDEDFRARTGIESVLPTVSVRALDERGVEIPAEVYLREVDLASGLPAGKRLLGTAPLPPTAVPSGYYRVEVDFDAGGFRELICNPGPTKMETALIATRRSNEATVGEGMVLFAATTFTLPADLQEEHWAGKTVSVESFLMDPTEVSNAQYAAFMDATGHRAPFFWHLAPDRRAFLEKYGDRPVSGVAWPDAVAFAEWSGKRLPTALEWLLAAAGPEGRPFPYAASADAAPRGNVRKPSLGTSGSEQEAWDMYLSCTAPVRSDEDACTPTGLYHMWGNVEERTESIPIEPRQGPEVAPLLQSRFCFGGAWNAIANGGTLRRPAFVPMSESSHPSSVGFRCAKSAVN